MPDEPKLSAEMRATVLAESLQVKEELHRRIKMMHDEPVAYPVIAQMELEARVRSIEESQIRILEQMAEDLRRDSVGKLLEILGARVALLEARVLGPQ